MLFQTLCLLTITGYFQVQSYVPVPSIYKKVEVALRRYSSHTNYNPVIHSLLNILVHDKRAKAFTTDEAIEKSLDEVKKFNKKDESVLRQIIYGTRILSPSQKLSPALEGDIESALNQFFTHPNVDDNQTFDIKVVNEKKH